MEISNEQVMLAYEDVIVVMGEIKKEVINTTSKLINASEGMGLHVNLGKTIYMVNLRRLSNICYIGVDNFKYLGANMMFETSITKMICI